MNRLRSLVSKAGTLLSGWHPSLRKDHSKRRDSAPDADAQRPEAPSYSAEQLVTALYLGVLGRQPDPMGMAEHSRALASGACSSEELARTFRQSDEFRGLLDPDALTDVTQFGELRHIIDILLHIGVRTGIIVDVGARGIARSNSYNLLRDFRWSGILIEANPRLIEPLRRDFDGLAAQIVGCAVGTARGTLPFFIGANDDVSSLLAGHASAWGPLREQVEVEVRKLEEVLDEHGVPLDFDVLSLDIEGLDVDVMNALVSESSYRPRVVIIEASHDFHTKTLADAGLSTTVQDHYRLVRQTRANLIMVAADDLEHGSNTNRQSRLAPLHNHTEYE